MWGAMAARDGVRAWDQAAAIAGAGDRMFTTSGGPVRTGVPGMVVTK